MTMHNAGVNDKGEDVHSKLTRRGVLGLAVAAGAATALGACGSESETETAEPGGSGSSPAAEPSAADDSSSSAPAQATALAEVGDVPVGGGVILAGPKIVVTQPAAGEFKAFTAVCTHQGCVVGSVKANTINCQCHGSAFNAADGSVRKGPATQPLRAIKVKVEGDSVVKA